MSHLAYAPILFASALKNKGLDDLGELLQTMVNQRQTRVPTPALTRWARGVLEDHNPKAAQVFYCHQSGISPPSFVCHVNEPKRIHFSVKRHMLNSLREHYDFMGTPLRIKYLKTGRTLKSSITKRT